MSSDDDFARFLATRDPALIEGERFGHPSSSERTGSLDDRLMRAEHEARRVGFWRTMRGEITPLQFRDLINECVEYKPAPNYKPRRGTVPASKQLQIAVEAAGKRIA
ncbi:hypothetical protein ACSAGD_10590 [Paramicrobacterium sp. CJ85]|uniref:hypothetical protein n=1 Tax=Paramicrobacterium sp. CJ85 TaxID=3445355 RepID=UPI003F62DBDC